VVWGRRTSASVGDCPWFPALVRFLSATLRVGCTAKQDAIAYVNRVAACLSFWVSPLTVAGGGLHHPKSPMRRQVMWIDPTRWDSAGAELLLGATYWP